MFRLTWPSDMHFEKTLDFDCQLYGLLAHLSRRLTRWAYRMELEPASVRPCVCVCVRPHFQTWISLRPAGGSQLNFIWSITGGGGGKAALGFGSDQIRNLVSMATDGTHRLIMGKRASSRLLGCFDQIFLILAGNDDIYKSLHEFEIWSDLTTDYRVSCPWASKKNSHILIMGKTMSSRFLSCFWSDPFHTCR